MTTLFYHSTPSETSTLTQVTCAKKARRTRPRMWYNSGTQKRFEGKPWRRGMQISKERNSSMLARPLTAIVVCSCLLTALAGPAGNITFSSTGAKQPRTYKITPAGSRQYQNTRRARPAQRRYARPENASVPSSAPGAGEVPAGRGEPIRSFAGIPFGVPITQTPAEELGYFKFSPKYFMLEDAFPMTTREGRRVSGFRSEGRCRISSPEQAQQILMQMKADIEKRTGCPLVPSDSSTLRRIKYEFSGKYSDVYLSCFLADDDLSAKFRLEINNVRWVR